MPLARSKACNCAGYAPWLPTYQPWVLLAPIATIRSGAALAAMLPQINAETANRTALPRRLAMAVSRAWPARNVRPLSRLWHRQDGALNFRLDLGTLVHGDVGNAKVATEIDVRELAAIAGIGRHRRAPAR